MIGNFLYSSVFPIPGLLLTSASKTPCAAASSSDFLSFSDSSLRPGGGTTFSSPPSFSSCLPKPTSEGGASEGTTTLFGSLMSATTASAGIHKTVFKNQYMNKMTVIYDISTLIQTVCYSLFYVHYSYCVHLQQAQFWSNKLMP